MIILIHWQIQFFINKFVSYVAKSSLVILLILYSETKQPLIRLYIPFPIYAIN